MKVAEGSFILCYQHLRSRSPKVSLGRLTGLCILTWVNSSLTKHRSSNNTETTSSCSTDSYFNSLEQKFSFFAPVFLSSPLPDITAFQPQKLFSFTSWISLTLSLRGNRNDLPCARSLVLLPWFLVGTFEDAVVDVTGRDPAPAALWVWKGLCQKRAPGRAAWFRTRSAPAGRPPCVPRPARQGLRPRSRGPEPKITPRKERPAGSTSLNKPAEKGVG